MGVLEVSTAGLAMSAFGWSAPAPTGGREEISELSETACMILISASSVARLAFVSSAGPELVSVNYSFVDGRIYFLTEPKGFLARLKCAEHAVAFGVDHDDDKLQERWEVTVRGTASRAGERAARRVLHRLRPFADSDKPVVMHIEVDSIAGRRVSRG